MEIFKIFGIIDIESEEAKAKIEAAKESAEEFNKKFKSGIDVAKKVGKAVVAAGAAIGGAMVAVTESTRQYRTEQAKLETAFEQGGFSADTARKTYEGLNAVLGDSGRSVEAVNHLAKLVDTEEDLSKWTDICTGVFATFGDSLPIEGLTEAANETAKVGQVTGPLADALNWAGVNEDAFNEKLAACSSEQERQALITETLTGLYSEAAETYKKTSEDVMAANTAQDKLNNSMAKVGEVLEPYVTKGKELVAEVLEKAVPMIERFGEKMQELSVWIKDNEDKVKGWAAILAGAIAIIGVFATAMNWSGIMSTALTALVKVTNGMKLFNTAVLQNPVALITAAIIALVAAFAYLWNTSDAFRQFWINLWEQVKTACASAVEYFRSLWVEFLQPVFNEIMTFVNEEIVPFFKAAFEIISESVGVAFEEIKGWWNNVLKPAFVTIGNFIKTVLAPIFKVVFAYIGQAVGTAFNFIRNIWNNSLKPVFKGITTFLSGVFTGNWKKIFQGIANIAAGAVNGVIMVVEKMVNDVIAFANSLIDKINAVITKAGFDAIGKIGDVTLKRIEVKESDINYGKQEAQIEDNTIDGAEIDTGSLTASLDGLTAQLDSLPTDIATASSTEAATSTPSASTSKGGSSGGGTYTLSESNISTIVNKIKDAIGANAPEDVTSIKDSVLGFVEKFDTHSTHLADLKSAMVGTDGEEGMCGDVREMKEALLAFVEALPTILQEAFAAMKFDVDNREFARLVKAVN